MCLSISRLFWVSSLAYPNLLGTKGYVVVGVVVVLVVVGLLLRRVGLQSLSPQATVPSFDAWWSDASSKVDGEG
jgi:hypothetical protein